MVKMISNIFLPHVLPSSQQIDEKPIDFLKNLVHEIDFIKVEENYSTSIKKLN